MRSRIGRLTIVACFLLWIAALGVAQQSEKVQITQGPKVESVTVNTATIAWSTNVSASTILKYGTSASALSQTAETPWGGITHRVTLHNLQPNTTYFFEVESSQAQGTGTSASSKVAQFKTQNGPASAKEESNETPPQEAAEHGGNASQNPDVNKTGAANPAAQPVNAKNFQVVAGPIPQQVTASTATLWWGTNEPIQGSTVKYGTSQVALNQLAHSTSADGLSHSSQLTNLQPATTYYIQIVRPDRGISAGGNFKTQPANYSRSKNVQLTNGPIIEQLADNQAVIAWVTSAPSSSIVKYGTSPNGLSQRAEAPWTAGTHRVTLKNLRPNTKYYFQIESSQAKGTGTGITSGVYPFQTVATGQAAMNIAPKF